ncbi:MAG: acyltransferase family protein [Oscillospiraceae bacterium]|nr:acyltransferase family protein [Oscillospiraceae bacterium]
MRKPFLDHLRYSIVLLVILYHVFYLFNSVGVITNVAIPGIPALDALLYVLYPWFMVALFLISGICARYSLQKQTNSAFLKSKVRRQLIPSIAIIFIIGWTSGWVTSQYNDMFGTNGGLIPGFAKYLIWCLSGIGVLWFLHELLLAELVLVLVRKIDRKERLWHLGGKANMAVLCLLVFALWGSAQILNTPLIELYRNGIYIFAFLIGYFVFSHDRVQELLSKWAPVLLAGSGLLAVLYTASSWGENYAAMSHLKSFLTNFYAWFATLAVLGAGKRWLDRDTGFTRYMAGRSFGFYVLHYPLLALSAWAMDKILHLPVWSMYLLLPIEMAVLLPPLVALVKRLPILRTLILGEK